MWRAPVSASLAGQEQNVTPTSTSATPTPVQTTPIAMTRREATSARATRATPNRLTGTVQVSKFNVCWQDGVACRIRVHLCVCVCVCVTCLCKPGWTGTECDTNVNECDSNPCPDYSYCNDTEGSYKCTCNTGYKCTCNTGYTKQADGNCTGEQI